MRRGRRRRRSGEVDSGSRGEVKRNQGEEVEGGKERRCGPAPLVAPDVAVTPVKVATSC